MTPNNNQKTFKQISSALSGPDQAKIIIIIILKYRISTQLTPYTVKHGQATSGHASMDKTSKRLSCSGDRQSDYGCPNHQTHTHIFMLIARFYRTTTTTCYLPVDRSKSPSNSDLGEDDINKISIISITSV